MVFTSMTVAGSSDLSARDVEYSITLDGLTSGTFYVANIVANNSFGGLISPDISFATTPLGTFMYKKSSHKFMREDYFNYFTMQQLCLKLCKTLENLFQICINFISHIITYFTVI